MTTTRHVKSLYDVLLERGRIAPGLFADATLLTPDLRVAATMVQGQVVYSN